MKSKSIEELRIEFTKNFGPEEDCVDRFGKQDSSKWYSRFEGWISAYTQYYEPIVVAHQILAAAFAKAVREKGSIESNLIQVQVDNEELRALIKEIRPLVGESVLHRPLREVVAILNKMDALTGESDETRMDTKATQTGGDQRSESAGRTRTETQTG